MVGCCIPSPNYQRRCSSAAPLALLRPLLRVGDFQLETKVEAPVERKQFEFE